MIRRGLTCLNFFAGASGPFTGQHIGESPSGQAAQSLPPGQRRLAAQEGVAEHRLEDAAACLIQVHAHHVAL